jgi:hypothetical protein
MLSTLHLRREMGRLRAKMGATDDAEQDVPLGLRDNAG